MTAVAERSLPHSPKARRYIVRPHIWLEPREPLVCPNGHRIRTNAGIPSHETLICQHRVGGEVAECGLRVYVRRMPDGRHYIAQLSPAEMIHIRDKNMDPDAALAYLSTPPRV